MRAGWHKDSGESPVDGHERYYRRSSPWYHTTMAEARKKFSDNVKENPAQEPYLPVLLNEELARMEVELSPDAVLYRARVGFLSGGQCGMQLFEGAAIGAPPPEKAKPGRANVKGDVVLYVADQEVTAIAEVRPWRGRIVSVARVGIVRDLHRPLARARPRSSGRECALRPAA
jgi:hypothetical protein